MGFLDGLFSRQRARTGSHFSKRTSDAVARVLALNPRLKYAHHYEERLTRSLTTSLHYTDNLVASLPPMRECQRRRMVV